MSALDLIKEWEDTLVQALQPTVGLEVSDEDLEMSQGPLLQVKAGIRAGYNETGESGWTCGPACD